MSDEGNRRETGESPGPEAAGGGRGVGDSTDETGFPSRASGPSAGERPRWDLIDAGAIVCYETGAVGAGAWVGEMVRRAAGLASWRVAAGKIVYVLVWCALVLPVVPLVAKRWWGASRRELGIAGPREGSFRWFVRFALLLGAVYLALGLVCLLVHHYVRHWLGVRPEAAAEAIRLHGGVYPMLLAFLVAAPLTEELAFRGVLYPALRARLGVGRAVLVSAVIFAAIHPLQRWTFFLPVTQFLGGLIFAWSYEKTRSLVYPVIFHAVGNAGVVGWTLAAAHGPGWISWML